MRLRIIFQWSIYQIQGNYNYYILYLNYHCKIGEMYHALLNLVYPASRSAKRSLAFHTRGLLRVYLHISLSLSASLSLTLSFSFISTKFLTIACLRRAVLYHCVHRYQPDKIILAVITRNAGKPRASAILKPGSISSIFIIVRAATPRDVEPPFEF